MMTYLESRIKNSRAARDRFIGLAREFASIGKLDAARFAVENAKGAQKLVRRYRGFGS